MIDETALRLLKEIMSQFDRPFSQYDPEDNRHCLFCGDWSSEPGKDEHYRDCVYVRAKTFLAEQAKEDTDSAPEIDLYDMLRRIQELEDWQSSAHDFIYLRNRR